VDEIFYELMHSKINSERMSYKVQFLSQLTNILMRTRETRQARYAEGNTETHLPYHSGRGKVISIKY
jgi:hypothetical protein